MIGLDAPQGMLNLKCPNSNQYRNLKFLVKEKGSHQLLNVQNINEIKKYIVGNYDIEVLTVPRISLKDVEIRQSHTTNIKIPQPGILNILREGSGYGSLFQIKDNNKLKWILNFSPNHEKQSLILQPGEYEITYRPKNIKNTMFTRRKSFIVKSGSSTTITLD
jgi:Ca-activated chloride channel family protein